MTLSTLSIVLGLGLALPQIYGIINPSAFRSKLIPFPRSLSWGYPLITLATLWFLYLVANEQVADFAAYKNLMLIGFAALGIGTAIYLSDFLAARALAVLLLLAAKLLLGRLWDTESSWRLVISVWAYVWVIAGMWIAISPWRLRDWIEWMVKTDKRIRALCGFRLAFFLFVSILGLTAFRS